MNLLALIVAPTIVTTTGAYLNVMMPYLLQDERYFGIKFENVGAVIGNLLFWSHCISTLITPLIGYLYDLLGRFWVIIPSCFILALGLGLIPFSAPHYWLLCVLRAVISCFVNVVMINPLIIDYVKTESRGLVMSYMSLGMVFGELFMVNLFAATRNLDMLY